MAALTAVRRLLGRCLSASAGTGPGTRDAPRCPGVLRGARATVAAAVLVSSVVTTAFALLPHLRPERDWPSARAAVETSASLIALFATLLVFGRLRRHAFLNELLLASAFALLTVSDLLFVAVPAVAGWGPDGLTVWGPPLAHSLGAVLFVLTAVIPRRALRRAGPALVLASLAVITAIGLTASFVPAFAAGREARYLAPLSLEAAARLGLRAFPALFALELSAALLYGLAALGFLGRSRRLDDSFSGWLAVAAALAMMSHVNYALFPASYSQSVLYPGGMFRFTFYVALLAGCLREIWSHWNALPAAAVLEDRRRMARDLHDGVAQELACISRNLDLITGKANRQAAALLRSAADRAQAELRSAITALAPPRDSAAGVALARAASEVAQRFRIGLDLDVAAGIELPPACSEALVRIACEAVTNSARHSGAKRVTLRLHRDASLVRLHVTDSGCGFDPTEPASGFGLCAMRDRARSVGGELYVCSVPGQGSEVCVAVWAPGRGHCGC